MRVVAIEELALDVRLIRFAEGGAYAAGAHVVVRLPVGERRYSLVSTGGNYEIAVKRHAGGRGGSRHLHEIHVGDELDVSAPISEFGLASAAHHVLIAGGIGITPMVSLVAELERTGASYELHYVTPTPVLLDRLPHVTLYAQRFAVEDLVAQHPHAAIYVCGPAGLIDRVRLAASQRVHFESFGPAWSATDGTVRLALAQSGLALEVPAGTTLLDAMEAAGAWAPSECRRGECGTCITTYTSGRPIHRDHCLTEEQRAHSFCPCVSWASSDDVLTLDL